MPKNKRNKLPVPVPGPVITFDCVECGRTITRFELPPPGLLLCCECVFHPGWFRDARLRYIIDPWGHANPPPHELEPVEPGDERIM